MSKQIALLLIFLMAFLGGCRKKPPQDISTQNESQKDILTTPNGNSADITKPEKSVSIIQKTTPPQINKSTEPESNDLEPEPPEQKSVSKEPEPVYTPDESAPSENSTDDEPPEDTEPIPVKNTEISIEVTAQEKTDKDSDPNTLQTPETNTDQQPEKPSDQAQTQPVNNKQSAPADPNKTTTVEAPEKKEPLSDFMKQDLMQACDYVFRNFVDENGNVDYLTLRRKRRQLNDAVEGIANLPKEKLLSWSDEEKMAFWINAHNILTVKLIIDNYPIKPHWWAAINYPANSIKQIVGAREKILFRIAGFQYKLEEIEHDLLKGFQDPRICFALTYATRSGAILRNEAYDPDKLDEQLDEQVSKYLAEEKNFSIDKSNKKISLSSILKLKNPKMAFENSEYGKIKRFRDKPDDIRAFLNFILFYLPPEDVKTLKPMDFDVEFKIYDWELNEQGS